MVHEPDRDLRDAVENLHRILWLWTGVGVYYELLRIAMRCVGWAFILRL
jgi:hypothetical protein